VVYFFAGFLLAAYSKLGLTAIALIGTVLALMLYQVKYGDSGKIAAAASGTKSLDEQLDDLDN
jgi:PTS system mannose-specific IIC component